MKKSFFSIIFLIFLIIFLWFSFFGPVGNSSQTEVFVVQKGDEKKSPAESLKKNGFIKNKEIFNILVFFLRKKDTTNPGGYELKKNMNIFEVIDKVKGEPDLIWITFSGCLRKEQIGEIFAHYLGWNEEELRKWNTEYTNEKTEYKEGVYYPDTYLIPKKSTGSEIAKRLINRFNDKFAPFADAYIKANIRWVTGLKIASLIAREAAGKEDMKLISGIIWNRLMIGMPLQIDATMQYTHGKNDDGSWWGAISIAEKEKDSPYNSYLYKGLPPTPICSPDIDYIEAVLHPDDTECLFYLHDENRKIHCAKTYEEHLKNIETYLE